MKRKMVTAMLFMVLSLAAFQGEGQSAIYIQYQDVQRDQLGNPLGDSFYGFLGGNNYNYSQQGDDLSIWAGPFSIGYSKTPVGPVTSILGFCVEPSQPTSGNLLEYSLLSITSDRQKMAAVLANRYATGGLSSYDMANPGGAYSPEQIAAATQAAIWELVLDTDSVLKIRPVSEGDTDHLGNTYFSYGSYSYPIYSVLAQELVTWAHDHLGDYQEGKWAWAHNDVYQDYLAPVPIPPSVLLLGPSLIGVVLIRRRVWK